MPRYASSSSSAAVGVLENTVTPELDWELLYDLYADRLRRIIQRKVGPTLTEDVLQETFLRAFRNRHTIDPGRPLAPWLITIALRAATDAQRRQLRTVDSDLVEPPCEETGFGAVEEELVRRARHLGIKHALASLNTKQRRMLEAVAVEGLAYDQLAASEQMSPHAVKTAIARARTNFRSSYAGYTRETGLFGGAVGGLVLKLRARMQRWHNLVGDHAAAFGAATVTVVAVGIAAYPAARAIPTAAAEMAGLVHASADSRAVGMATPAPVSSSTYGETSASATRPAGASDERNEPALAGVSFSANSTFVHDDSQAVVTVQGDQAVPDGDHSTDAGMEVDCTAHVVGQATCAVLRHAFPSP